jgi:hypothetical protein
MKALAPYLVSAALIFPPSVATGRALPESFIEAGVFVDSSRLSQMLPESTEISVYSWDASRPELAPALGSGIVAESNEEAYEPFVATEAWVEIPVAPGSFKISLEERPVSFFDERDIAGIDQFE